MSAANEADRMPVLFLEWRPAAWFRVSRRTRLMGRTVEAVMARSLAELGGCFALGGLLFAMDGDGDDADDAAPLVWMPGGTGRLILVETFCCTAVVVAVVTLVGAIVTPDARRRACCGILGPPGCSRACSAYVAASIASIYLRRNCSRDAEGKRDVKLESRREESGLWRRWLSVDPARRPWTAAQRARD